MPSNPEKRLVPGDRLKVVPHRAWNRMLDLAGDAAGAGLPRDNLATSVEVLVRNSTASAVERFGILGVNATVTPYAENANEFLARDALVGIAPTADDPFVVVQEPIAAGAIGRARILGLTRVQVSLTAESDTHAAPTTTTEYLTTGTSGPARIIKVEPSSGGSGSGGDIRWASVLLGGDDGGDVVDIVELNNSGETPPTGYQDARVRNWDVDTDSLLIGENIWLVDVTQ